MFFVSFSFLFFRFFTLFLVRFPFSFLSCRFSFRVWFRFRFLFLFFPLLSFLSPKHFSFPFPSPFSCPCSISRYCTNFGAIFLYLLVTLWVLSPRMLEQVEDENVSPPSTTIAKPLSTTPYTLVDIAGAPCAGVGAKANLSLVRFPNHDSSWSEMESDERTSPQPRCDNRWKTFHGDCNFPLGHGNVMCYRWITSLAPISKHMDSMSDAGASFEFSRRILKFHTGGAGELLIIALPDIFMTLDSMQRCLGQLLERNHVGRMLLVSHWGFEECCCDKVDHVFCNSLRSVRVCKASLR